MAMKRNLLKILAVGIVSCLILTSNAFSASGRVAGKVQTEIEGESARLQLKILEGESSTGKRFFKYKLADSSETVFVKVKYLRIDDGYAWFAGKALPGKSSTRSNQWVFAVVHDGGIPGELVDHMWWQWLGEGDDAEKQAKEKVEELEQPEQNYPIESGDLVVENY